MEIPVSQIFFMAGDHSSKLILKQVVLEVILPPCHQYSRVRIVQQLTRRQLKQVRSVIRYFSNLYISFNPTLSLFTSYQTLRAYP
jgi:hypothetical protein